MSVAVALGPSWGFDTTYRFIDLTVAKRMRASVWNGNPLVFVMRYVSLGNPNFTYDIGPSERDVLEEADFMWGLVQHVEFPHWQAGASAGMAHGKAAAVHARLVGYPPGSDVTVDMEGLGNPGGPAVEYLAEWAKPLQDAGFNVGGGVEYEGFDDGIPSMSVRRSLYDSRVVRKTWGDFGHREPLPGVGFVMVQHSQVTINDIEVDIDEARVADDGAQLFLASRGDAIAPDNGGVVADSVDPAAGAP